jgi:hypothetical protein
MKRSIDAIMTHKRIGNEINRQYTIKTTFMACICRDQFFDRVRYPPPTIPSALEAASQPERLIRERGTSLPRDRRYMYAFFQHVQPSFLDGMNLDTAVRWQAWFLHRHLDGQHTIGSYVINAHGDYSYAAMDADKPSDLAALRIAVEAYIQVIG